MEKGNISHSGQTKNKALKYPKANRMKKGSVLLYTQQFFKEKIKQSEGWGNIT